MPENPDPTSSEEPQPRVRVAVGRINAPWGVRGHVKVTPMTDNPERFAKGARVFVDGVLRTILDVRYPRGFPVVQFEGIPNPEAADELRGTLIEIDEGDLADLPEGEYYVHDLVGLTVVTTEGEELGRLSEVLQTGSNDVYVVRRRGAPDVLVPALEGIVMDVDLDAGRMTIEVVPGLLG